MRAAYAFQPPSLRMKRRSWFRPLLLLASLAWTASLGWTALSARDEPDNIDGDQAESRASPEEARSDPPTSAAPRNVAVDSVEAGKAEGSPSTTDAPVESPPAQPGGEAAETVAEVQERLKEGTFPRPATFRGIEVGKTRLEEVESLLGQGEITLEGTNSQTRRYRVVPFETVEVTFAANVAKGVVIHLGRLLRVDTIAEQLSLDLSSSVVVRGDEGQPIGQAFPDQGVLLHFAPDRGGRFVAHVLLDPISPEAFLLRAKQWRHERPTQALRDLDRAAALAPDRAEPMALKSRIFLALRRPEEAMAAADAAARLDPGNPEYLVLQARSRFMAGRHNEAERMLQQVLPEQLPPESLLAALFEQLHGDMMAAGPHQDLEKAIVAHQRAIALAEPLALSPDWETRRDAKELLLEAHLAVAADIAWGRYRGKHEVLPKWLDRAEQIADNLVAREGLPEFTRMAASQAALACAVAAPGEMQSEAALNRALQIATRELRAKREDPLLESHLRWTLGTMLHDAMLIAHAARRPEQALAFGEAAVVQLREVMARSPDAFSSVMEHQLGETLFRLGAVHAIHKHNHARAVELYTQALAHLDKVAIDHDIVEPASVGEIYISMGVSFWAQDDRAKAVALTVRGIELLERAVADGQLEEAELAVPYGNLAAMHRSLGDERSSQLFAEMASEVQTKRR